MDITIINTRKVRNRFASPKTIGAVVPMPVYALACKQAADESMTVSQLGARLWQDYLRDMGTTLEVA